MEGANIDACDELGRTAYELTMFQHHQLPPSSKASLVNQRIHELIINIIQNAQSKDSVSMMQIDLNFLGRRLLHVDDDVNALRALMTDLSLPDPLCVSHDEISKHTIITYDVYYDHCQTKPIYGKRYKCRVCDDVDLCGACKELYDEGKNSSRVCEGHRFLETPETSRDLPMMVFEKELYLDKTKAWLQELHDKYENIHSRLKNEDKSICEHHADGDPIINLHSSSTNSAFPSFTYVQYKLREMLQE